MKYYAVTEDPRELYHYGVKGMKWGQHIFGDKPKSPGYHRAAKKLKAIASKTASGAKIVGRAVQKTAAQISYNNRARQENKYNKAVQKAQQRIRLTDTFSNLGQEDKYRKQLARDQKMENLRQKQADIQANNDLKTLRKAVKVEKHMPEYYQKAREGTLKYGKLTDEQIARLQNRLILEANTRRLGSTEEPSWREQKKMARRQGYLQGITKGTSAAMEEVARAGVQYGIRNLQNRKKLDAASEQRAKREKAANRIKNKKSRAEVREDFKQDVYENQVKEGMGFGTKHAAKNLRKAETQKLNRQARIDEARDERKFLMDERHNAIRTERQDRENEAREERKLELAGQRAYLYGYDPSNNQNGNGGNKGNRKKGGGDVAVVPGIEKYYEQKYLKNETMQDKAAREKKEQEARAAQAEKDRKQAEMLNDRQERDRKIAEEVEQRKLAEQQLEEALNKQAEERREAAKREKDKKKREKAFAKGLDEIMKRTAEEGNSLDPDEWNEILDRLVSEEKPKKSKRKKK